MREGKSEMNPMTSPRLCPESVSRPRHRKEECKAWQAPQVKDPELRAQQMRQLEVTGQSALKGRSAQKENPEFHVIVLK